MDWKKICILTVLGIASSSLYLQNRAFSADAYFTPHDIKRQILHSIEESKETIDIAVSDITSNDILNALVKAQERGVQVRVVVGRKHALMKERLSNLHKNKECAFRALVKRGLMHNNFAIFDCKLLVTGSYYWSENVSKFNRDNAIFTDDAKVLMKYQREFDCLFLEGITSTIKEATPIAKEKFETVESKPAAITTTDATRGKQVIVSNYGIVITENPDGYIAMNFEEFNNVFGMASDLSDEQKESLWSRCVDKKVKWNGKVTYIGWGLVTGWMMSITYGDTSVEIKLNSANKGRFSRVKYGNTVNYTGKLDSRVTKIFPYKLNEGDVLEVEDTPPKHLTYNELIENPDVIPVSQGPKKIFLVESFNDLDNIFSRTGSLSDAQKDEEWKKYEGKYVSWSGQILYKNLNVASGLRIVMTQKEKGDVELKVSLTKKDTVLKFEDGETILYTGKLVKRRGNNSPYILEDGNIVTMK